jgi:RNA recognition motif-containing protein
MLCFDFWKIKRDANGQSRGFGFIRFKNYESQLAVINKRHFIDGRHVDVKIPDSKVKFSVDTFFSIEFV